MLAEHFAVRRGHPFLYFPSPPASGDQDDHPWRLASRAGDSAAGAAIKPLPFFQTFSKEPTPRKDLGRLKLFQG